MLLDFSLSTALNILCVILVFYMTIIKSYLQEKGKNAATKEDVEDITRKVELIKVELTKETETFKSDLNRLSMEHQIAFGKLHEARAMVIIELYRKLIDLKSSMFNFTRTGYIVYEDSQKEESERMKLMNDSFNDFKKFYLYNKLYFSKSICIKIEKIITEYFDKGWEFGFALHQIKECEMFGGERKALWERQKEISESIQNDMPPLIEEIEDYFRLLLGVKG